MSNDNERWVDNLFIDLAVGKRTLAEFEQGLYKLADRVDAVVGPELGFELVSLDYRNGESGFIRREILDRYQEARPGTFVIIGSEIVIVPDYTEVSFNPVLEVPVFVRCSIQGFAGWKSHCIGVESLKHFVGELRGMAEGREDATEAAISGTSYCPEKLKLHLDGKHEIATITLENAITMNETHYVVFRVEGGTRFDGSDLPRLVRSFEAMYDRMVAAAPK